jgi:hypothetical protein
MGSFSAARGSAVAADDDLMMEAAADDVSAETMAQAAQAPASGSGDLRRRSQKRGQDERQATAKAQKAQKAAQKAKAPTKKQKAKAQKEAEAQAAAQQSKGPVAGRRIPSMSTPDFEECPLATDYTEDSKGVVVVGDMIAATFKSGATEKWFLGTVSSPPPSCA